MVGIGPGDPLDRTVRAERTLAQCSVIIGYRRYIELVEDLCGGKRVISSSMRAEVERCQMALDEASRGETVGLISSGDAGVYGMAGLVLELANQQEITIPIEVVAGVTAASACAARIGAPLMLDFTTISLSDLLVPWPVIQERLQAVASADLVTVLYNPRSRRRQHQLEEAIEIFLSHRSSATPCAVGRSIGRKNESIYHVELGRLAQVDVDMHCVVIIGNRQTERRGCWMITPRGYPL